MTPSKLAGQIVEGGQHAGGELIEGLAAGRRLQTGPTPPGSPGTGVVRVDLLLPQAGPLSTLDLTQTRVVSAGQVSRGLIAQESR